jgi:hypothetical protein
MAELPDRELFRQMPLFMAAQAQTGGAVAGRIKISGPHLRSIATVDVVTVAASTKYRGDGCIGNLLLSCLEHVVAVIKNATFILMTIDTDTFSEVFLIEDNQFIGARMMNLVACFANYLFFGTELGTCRVKLLRD